MLKNYPHISIALQTEIKRLVKLDEIEKAAELLVEIGDISGDQFSEEAILICQGVNQLSKHNRLGILSEYEELARERSKLGIRILKTAKALLSNYLVH